MLLKLAKSTSIGTVVYAKRNLKKARVTFRRTLAQQGLPDGTVETLTSAYGNELKKLSSVSRWMKQSGH